ncbi:hypothetical protein ACLI4Y_07690 [Natrialbaceae archaeon A-CW3]
MDSNVEPSSASAEQNRKSLGVRFAESSVGEPVINGLLFITNSFWLMLAAAGVILVVIAAAVGEGVMAGITGVFGLSAIAVGAFGYLSYLYYVSRQDTRS